jgi:AcrR family transcriptional regulator
MRYRGEPGPVAERVAARFRRSDVIADPNILISKLESVIDSYRNDEHNLPKMREGEKLLKEDPSLESKLRTGVLPAHVEETVKHYLRERYAYAYRVGKVMDRIHGVGVSSLFLAILQQYALPAALRKKVEAGAKFFAKTRLRKPSEEDALDAFEQMLATLREYLAIARQAVQEGKPFSSGGSGGTHEFRKAGPFRLVNTGGFDDPTMDEVVKVVEAAWHLMSSKGLTQVGYGDILVSNTLAKSTVLAFYLIGKDEMFVRANLKGEEKTAVRTIVHELGHRLEFKFLTSKKAAINTMYLLYKMRHRENVVRDPSIPAPEAGMDLKVGRTVWKVQKVDHVLVYLVASDNPKKTGTMSIDAWYKAHGAPTAGGKFVTQYAKKDASENFAEMVAEYCLGKLNPEQTEDLEKILK